MWLGARSPDAEYCDKGGECDLGEGVIVLATEGFGSCSAVEFFLGSLFEL